MIMCVTNFQSYPGYINIFVLSDFGSSCPFLSVQDSRTLTLVVPTAIIFLPFFFALFSASAVFLSSVNHSECILWSFILSTFTGSNVPRPT